MAVAFNAVSASQSLGGVTGYSFSHTVAAGSNLYIELGLGAAPNTADIATATYAGVSLSLVGNIDAGAVNGNTAEIWGLINPATGTNTMSVTGDEALYGGSGSISYSGVHQTTPRGAATTGSGLASTNITITLASSAGDMVSDAIKSYQNALTVGASQTSRWAAQDGTFGEWGQGSTEGGQASVSMGWSVTVAVVYAVVAANIIQAAAGGAFVPTIEYIERHYPRGANRGIMRGVA